VVNESTQQTLESLMNQGGGGGFSVPVGLGMGMGMGMGEAPAPDAGVTGPRGFLIMIQGTTPFADPNTLIERDLVGALRAIAPTLKNPKMEYKVERVVTSSVTQIKEDSNRKAELKRVYDLAVQAAQRAAQGLGAGNSGFGGGFGGGYPTGGFEGEGGFVPGGFGGGYPGGFNPGGFGGGFAGGTSVTPTTGEDMAPYKDRLTEEVVLEDYQFTILMAVSLDPPAPAPPAQPGEQAAAQ
jgi:hypothetical protein